MVGPGIPNHQCVQISGRGREGFTASFQVIVYNLAANHTSAKLVDRVGIRS